MTKFFVAAAVALGVSLVGSGSAFASYYHNHHYYEYRKLVCKTVYYKKVCHYEYYN